MTTSSERSIWGTRLGFILASAGSAVGLGAIGKSPDMAGTNGGSAFIIPYIILTIAIGFIVLMIEMALGRSSRGGAAHALRLYGGPFWGYVGKISVLTGFLILAFYQVIGGWCLNYLFDACMGNGLITDTAQLGTYFDHFVTNGVSSVSMQLAFLALTAGVILFGVEKGIERISKFLMPTLFILMLCLIVRGLTLPGAWDGFVYMFKFDPQAFNGNSLLNAMGFAFFSLSLGSGSMMNYGSYLSDETKIGSSTAWIVFLAVAASILGGLMIMPAVFAFGLDPTAGPGLTFITMPAVFSQIPFGQFFAILFYLCIVVAAITSSVSMMEIMVAFLVDEHRFTRPAAAVLSTVLLAVVGALPALSFGELADVKFFGKTFFDLFDFFTSNISLPVGGLVILFLAGWYAWPKTRFAMAGNRERSAAWFATLRFLLLVLSPLLVLTVLVTGLL